MTTNRPETNDYSEGAPMTDKTIPANLTRKEARAVREWAERAWNTKVQDATVAHAARVLLAVLPKPPTLADMTEEERASCKWMQADTEQLGRAVILEPNASKDTTPAKVGDVIESADDPRIAALPVGSILLDRDGDTTTKRPREWTGNGFDPIADDLDKYGPWTVLHIPKEDDQ